MTQTAGHPLQELEKVVCRLSGPPVELEEDVPDDQTRGIRRAVRRDPDDEQRAFTAIRTL